MCKPRLLLRIVDLAKVLLAAQEPPQNRDKVRHHILLRLPGQILLIDVGQHGGLGGLGGRAVEHDEAILLFHHVERLKTDGARRLDHAWDVPVVRCVIGMTIRPARRCLTVGNGGQSSNQLQPQ